ALDIARGDLRGDVPAGGREDPALADLGADDAEQARLTGDIRDPDRVEHPAAFRDADVERGAALRLGERARLVERAERLVDDDRLGGRLRHLLQAGKVVAGNGLLDRAEAELPEALDRGKRLVRVPRAVRVHPDVRARAEHAAQHTERARLLLEVSTDLRLHLLHAQRADDDGQRTD